MSMNKLFKAINDLFESEADVVNTETLVERGSKYLKDIKPEDGKELRSYEPNKIDDRGIKTTSSERREKNPGKERFLYDVIKHLEPAGYHFLIKSDSYSRNNSPFNLYLMNGDKSYRIAQIIMDIDNDDNIEVRVEENASYDLPKDLFNSKADIQTIARQLAREKGENFDDSFMLDNAAEIKDKYNNQKTNGTLEELLRKVEAQLNKLPKNKMLSYMESVETSGDKLDEAFNASCPNWLKPYLKGRNKGTRGWAAQFDETTEFEQVPTDKIKGKDGLINLSKEAWDNGEELFVRTKNGIYRFYDGRWRNVKDDSITRSSEDIADSIIAAVKTKNKSATNAKNQEIRQNRKDAKDGSIERDREVSHWDIRDGYKDKSGYTLNPDKYKDMLRKINQEKLAGSGLVKELENADFVNRFNELGKKATGFIGQALDISYDNTSAYSGFDTEIIDQVQEAVKSAKRAIVELMNRVSYAKTGQGNSYYSGPDGTDVESWLRDQVEVVENKLNSLDKLVTKAEEEVTEE